MKTAMRSNRRLLVAAVYTVGLAAASLVQAAQPQFVGPRNTIPQAPAQLSKGRSFEQLRASTKDESMCTGLRFKHYGHPGKGYNRILKKDATCGGAWLSAR
jgi:hypothetical protein